VITIEYGLQANSNIDGETIALTPGVNENSDVIWVCGNATAPTGATMQTTGTTSVEDKYMPASCRTGFGN
jgi:type IV pilus assembly protein PilA